MLSGSGAGPIVPPTSRTGSARRVGGQSGAVNPDDVGTKAAAHYLFQIAPGATETVLLRLESERNASPFTDAEQIFADRIAEADAFYAALGEDR